MPRRSPCPSKALRVALTAVAVGFATLAASATAGAQGGPIGSLAPVGSAAGNRDLEPNPVAVRPLYVEHHSAVRARERRWRHNAEQLMSLVPVAEAS